MKLYIIATLSAFALSSFTTYSHAQCGQETGPRGRIDNCPHPPYHSSEDRQSDKETLQKIESISADGVLRLVVGGI
jgi:hypothetical protein